MQIVFGNNPHFHEITEKYTTLQLETFVVEGVEQIAYCIVETMPVEEIPDLPRLTELHQAIITAWNEKKFDTVLFGLPHVEGKFGGEMDSFYAYLKTRITNKTA